MYRRPSELGLATTPMEDKRFGNFHRKWISSKFNVFSEIKSKFQPMAGGRQHIVKPIPDHKETYQAAVEEWKEENVKETESTSHYKNLGAKRPVCQKLYDHLTLGVSVISLDFCVTISLHFITRHDSPNHSLSSATLLTHNCRCNAN